MNEENKNHYRYMPPGSAPETEETSAKAAPPEEKPEMAEESIILEETLTVEEVTSATEAPEDEAGNINIKLPEWVFSASRVLYALCSPVLIPTVVCLLIFLLSVLRLVVPEAVVPYTLTVFGATCVVPLIAIFVLLRVGAIDSVEMYGARERVVPYVIEFLALGGTTLFFIFKGANPWIWTIFCGGTAVALVNFLINFRMRISNHCSAMAAFLAALIMINRNGIPQTSLFWWAIGIVVLAGFTGTMAMVYGKHSLKEVLAGYATGFLGVILFSLIG